MKSPIKLSSFELRNYVIQHLDLPISTERISMLLQHRDYLKSKNIPVSSIKITFDEYWL